MEVSLQADAQLPMLCILLVMVNQPLGDTGSLRGARHKLKCQDTYSFVSEYFLSCEVMITHSPHASVMNINIF